MTIFSEYFEDVPFTLKGTKYNLNLFSGRFFYYLTIVNPLNLFYTSKQIYNLKDSLEAYRKIEDGVEGNQGDGDVGGIKRKSNKELWNDRIIVESALHPVTNEIIPWPFR